MSFNISQITSGTTLPSPFGFPPNSLFINTTTNTLFALEGTNWSVYGEGGGPPPEMTPQEVIGTLINILNDNDNLEMLDMIPLFADNASTAWIHPIRIKNNVIPQLPGGAGNGVVNAFGLPEVWRSVYAGLKNTLYNVFAGSWAHTLNSMTPIASPFGKRYLLDVTVNIQALGVLTDSLEFTSPSYLVEFDRSNKITTIVYAPLDVSEYPTIGRPLQVSSLNGDP